MKISNTGAAVHHRNNTFQNVLNFSFPFPMVVKDSKVGLHQQQKDLQRPHRRLLKVVEAGSSLNRNQKREAMDTCRRGRQANG